MRRLVAIHPPIIVFILVCLTTVWMYQYNEILAGVFSFGIFLMGIDIYKSHQRYFYLLEKLNNENVYKLVPKFSKSWCTRTTFICAVKHSTSINLCYKVMVVGMIRDLGYKWYHFFPDGTFKRNSTFFKKSFWKSFFFGGKV